MDKNSVDISSSKEKRLRLARLLQKRQQGMPGLHHTLAGQIKDDTSTLSQEHLATSGQLAPSSSAYNIPLSIYIEGNIVEAALKVSLKKFLALHEPLLAAIMSMNGQDSKQRDSLPSWDLPVLELQALPETMLEAEVQRLIDQAQQRPFDLLRGFLLHAWLLHLKPEKHLLLLTLHPLIIERWPFKALRHEIASLYTAAFQTLSHPAPSISEQSNTDTTARTIAFTEVCLPLSFAQRTFWFFHQLDILNGACNLSWTRKLRGTFQLDAFQKSLTEIVQRHESLCTTFPTINGEPVQLIHVPQSPTFCYIDLGGLGEENAEREVRRLAEQQHRQTFDLVQGPLFHICLLHLRAGEHVFVFSIHHVIADGWSFGVFWSEFISLYTAFVHGQSSLLPPLPIQYADYTIWQRQWLQGEILDRHLSYWRDQLTGVSPLPLPTDFPRSGRQTFRTSSTTATLSTELTQALKALCQQAEASLFMVLLAGLLLLLFKWTNRGDIPVGTLVADRSKRYSEKLIGCMINFLCLRVHLANELTIQEFLAQVKEVVLGAYAHQECHFERVIEILRNNNDILSDPRLNIEFLMQNFAFSDAKKEEELLKSSSIPVETQSAFFDLRFITYELGNQIYVSVNYKDELFKESTIQFLLSSYQHILENMSQSLSERVEHLTIDYPLLQQAEQVLKRERKASIVIAGTFTAEPLEEALAFWIGELALPFEVTFAPYNQVFQQLLDRDSLFAKNKQGINVLLIRLEDWLELAPDNPQNQTPEMYETQIEQIERDLTDALLSSQQNISAAPYILCFCAASPSLSRDKTWRKRLQKAEERVQSALQVVSGTYIIITTTEINHTYPVTDYYDAQTDKLGHIPFTRSYFAALGTTLARKIYALSCQPHKVLVLDCDQTLWQGHVGEDGIWGLEIDASREELQKYILRQYNAGMLICLCSKNNEQDVREVFDHRQMPLRWEHIMSWRINWQPKYKNLQSLAAELHLGLDNFIFIDDNPVECSQVRAYCPEVLTLQLPTSSHSLSHFLKHLWIFDEFIQTDEDLQRNMLYKQEKRREAVRRASLTLQDFLADLNLQVSITPVHQTQMKRVAQLTQRTNQFNCTGIRRAEYEIQQLCQQEHFQCLVVDVRDRFGDYGLVGVMIYILGEKALQVDTLLLSCRALGRGVEHTMLGELDKIALSQEASSIQIRFRSTAKNAPAREFLERAGGVYQQSLTEMPYYEWFTGQTAAAMVAETSVKHEREDEADKIVKRPSGAIVDRSTLAELLQRIAFELSSTERLLHKIDQHAFRRVKDQDRSLVSPRTPIEESLSSIWAQVLKVKQVGISDNFFQMGGHSLLATQVIARINASFSLDLPLLSIFDNPTVAQLTTIVEEMLQDKRSNQVPPLVPVSHSGPIPLSFAQQRLWFLDQLESGSVAYNNLFALRISDRIDATALQRSLTELIWRQEGLRTTFSTIDGEPVQVVSSTVSLTFIFVDLEGLSREKAAQEVRRLGMQEQQRTFDLARGPLFRTCLLHLQAEEDVLLLTLHHIISDEWSFGILRQELIALYIASAQGQPSPLPPLPIQYVDFTIWQQRWLQGEILDRHLTYWRTHLEGVPLLHLPTDFPRPTSQTFNGSCATLHIDSELTHAMREVSQREGVTLFMIFLASFQLMLAHYSGQEDISVGTPVANRTVPELENLIGFFANTLVLRTRFSATMSFRDLLAHVRDVCLQAYAHQDLPFQKVVDALNVERNLSFNPLFQVMFIMLNTPRPNRTASDVEAQVQTFEQESRSAKFDITLTIADAQTGDEFICTAEYNIDLFKHSTIERMLAHWHVLLTQLVTKPTARLGELPWLTTAEQHQILDVWKQTRRYWPGPSTIPERFTIQTSTSPDTVALVFEGQHFTYEFLHQQSCSLATHLQACDVGPETLVGICLDRSPEMIIALLGVLYAGGAYVSLDPAYPHERLAFILEDAQIGLIITQKHLHANLSEVSLPLFNLERTLLPSRTLPILHIPSHEKQQLMYVIYTSGSTGTPKGVMATHQATFNRLAWMWEAYPFKPGEACCSKTSLNFVDAVWELFGPLLGGCRLVLLPDDVFQDLERLVNVLEQEAVTRIVLVPTSLRMLLEQPQDHSLRLAHLQYWSISGEALTSDVARRFFDRFPGHRLLNLYGSSEVAADVLAYEVGAQEHALVPLGKPIANTHVILLDPQKQLVPVGVIGEMYVGGQGLARGYLGKPELTAERFIPDPWSQERGAWLYRTGDMGRYREDGTIEYLGRRDLQVKLHGIRIELEEVEASLKQHPAVQEVAVGIREDVQGEKKLTAYIVPRSGQEISLHTLHLFLQAKLPQPLLPTSLSLLESLPLLPNGKIDRHMLLQASTTATQTLPNQYVEPVTQTERTLVALWQQVLHKEKIGITDNFFNLGGDSLLGIRMLALARTAGIYLTPKHFIQCQTIAELSAITTQTNVAEAEEAEADQKPSAGLFALLPLQKWILERWTWINPHRWNMVGFFQTNLPLDCNLLEQIVRLLYSQHESLHTGFVQTSEGWRAFIADFDTIRPFYYVDISALSKEDQRSAIETTAEALQGNLNLFNGQVAQIAYFYLGSQQLGRILFLCHHAIMDGYSMRLLLQDFQTAYEQLSQGKRVKLQPKTTTVKKWVQRLEEYVETEQVRREATNYWLKLPRESIITLPGDFPGGEKHNTIESRREVVLSLNSEQTEALAKCVDINTSILDIVITSLLKALACWCGYGTFCLDVVDLGRQVIFDDIDLSNTIGCFNLMRRLVLDLREEDTLLETMELLKKQIRRIPNRGLGLNLLTYLSKDLQILKALSTLPFPQIMLNYMGQIDQAFSFSRKQAFYGRWAGEKIGLTRGIEETTDLCLCFTVYIARNRLTLSCEYSCHLFRDSTIQQLAEQFMVLLESIISIHTNDRSHDPGSLGD